MSATATVIRELSPAHEQTGIALRCLGCGGTLHELTSLPHRTADRLKCARCSSTIEAIDGIWAAIAPERVRQFNGPLTAYEAVREAEGRWSEDADFYKQLPWRDTTRRFNAQWRIRARSFEYLCDRVLPECMKRTGQRQLRVLDLGAGNCWMSYRLALQKHLPVAVDICVNQKDGLGSASHYASDLNQLFPRFQAEMDRLPFADGQFDLAIYNASVHYAQNYEATVREAVRVLRPNGAIAIVDSPTYAREADGEAMLHEKSAEFARRFGTASGCMGGQGYLTPNRLARLERIGIRWQRYSPWYGWSWAMRPILADLRRRRRPSQFYIYLGTLAQYTVEAE
jgi:SAM-dependent methyltransferase